MYTICRFIIFSHFFLSGFSCVKKPKSCVYPSYCFSRILFVVVVLIERSAEICIQVKDLTRFCEFFHHFCVTPMYAVIDIP